MNKNVKAIHELPLITVKPVKTIHELSLRGRCILLTILLLFSCASEQKQTTKLESSFVEVTAFGSSLDDADTEAKLQIVERGPHRRISRRGKCGSRWAIAIQCGFYICTGICNGLSKNIQ
jgi:hypothetical protein